MFATSLNPGVSIWSLDNLVREVLQVLLSVLVIEAATDQTLGSVDSVFRVLYGL